MSSRWISAVQSVQGRGHRKSNIVCQDKTLAITENKVKVLALSDGAGAARHAAIGAELAVKEVGQLLVEYFTILYEKEAGPTAQLICQQVRSAIRRKAEEMGEDLKEFSATLLFVAVEEGRYLAGHIGDGVIGFSQQQDVKVLSQPENGEFINLTYFITSPAAAQHLRIYKGALEDIDGFVLLSDGSAVSLYDRRVGELSRASAVMLQWLDQYPREEVEIALRKNITQWLLPKTTDDCSIALMRRLAVKKGPPVKALYFKHGKIALQASMDLQYCDNQSCDYYAKTGKGNLKIADSKRGIIYCKHCQHKMSITKNSFFYRLRRQRIQATLDCLYDLSQQDDLENVRKTHQFRQVTFNAFLQKAAQHLEELQQTLTLNFDLEEEALVRFEKHLTEASR